MRNSDVVGVKVPGRGETVGHVRYSTILGYSGPVYCKKLTGKQARTISGHWSDFVCLPPVETWYATEDMVHAIALALLDGTSGIELAEDGHARNLAALDAQIAEARAAREG
jgi:hypothetical protein